MTFEPNYEKVVSSYKKRIGEMQSQIEARLQLADGVTATRILCVNTKVNIVNSEIVQNAVNYYGMACIGVIYVDDNNAIRSMDYTLEFKDRLTAEGDIGANVSIVTANVIDTSAKIEAGAIRVSNILEVVADAIYSDDMTVLTSVVGDGIYTKCEDIDYSYFLGEAAEKFETSIDAEITDAVAEVLGVSNSVCLSKVEPYDNFVRVSGNITSTINYLTAGDNATVRVYNINNEFSQEIALTGVMSNSNIISYISTICQGVKVNTNIEGDKAIVNIIVPIEYRAMVFNTQTMSIVSDVYSTSNFLNVNLGSFDILRCYPAEAYTERINGSATIEDSDPFIDEILGASCGRVMIANTNISNGTMVLDGVAQTTVLYRNAETNSIVSYDMQIPFVLDFAVAGVPDTATPAICIDMSDVVAKVRRGTEIEVSADLKLYATFSDTTEDAAINAIAIADEKPASDCAMMIYVAKDGDTIWDIAKNMNVDEELILAQNPSLELPIQAGTRIVIYLQTIANM